MAKVEIIRMNQDVKIGDTFDLLGKTFVVKPASGGCTGCAFSRTITGVSCTTFKSPMCNGKIFVEVEQPKPEPKKVFTDFGVHCDTFEEYTRLKEVAEKIGWKYNTKFNPFNKSNSSSSAINCIYFTPNFDFMPAGIYACSLSWTQDPLNMLKDTAKILELLHIPFAEQPKKEEPIKISPAKSTKPTTKTTELECKDVHKVGFIKGCLYISKTKERIVQCTEDTKLTLHGTEVWCVSEERSNGIGHHTSIWATYVFESYDGELTLKQKTI